MRRKIEALLGEWKRDHRGQCLLVLGARHVGKTYTICRFGMENYKNVVRVDFALDGRARTAFDGDLDVDTVVMELSALYPDRRFDPHRTLIFLDEIQHCPNARASLKSFALDGRYDVIASSSLPRLGRGEVPSYPVGYEHIVRMNPMDFEEFLWALGVDEGTIEYVRDRIGRREPLGGDVLRAFMEYTRLYTVVGGMPLAVSRFSRGGGMDPVHDAHGEIIADYRDNISKYAGEDERAEILGCFDSLVEGCGSTGGTEECGHAVEWLEDAGIAIPCTGVSEPVAPLEAKAVGGRSRLYMGDTGLLLSHRPSGLRRGILAGDPYADAEAVAENLVATMLACQGRNLMYFERDSDAQGRTDRIGTDFVTMVSGKVTAVEVRSGEDRTCASLDKVMKNYRAGGIMVETRDIFTDDKGVLHVPLFAVAFMDAMDPPRIFTPDFGIVDEVNSMFRHEGK